MDSITICSNYIKKVLLWPRDYARRHRFRCYFAAFVMLLFLCFFWNRIFITIHSGEGGVLFSRFSGGTVMDRAYGEGMYVLWPWNIMYIYDLRIQEDPQEILALSEDGLPVAVQISIKYQIVPEELPLIHQSIGPDYKRKIIYPLITSAVRQGISHYRPDELYSTASLELQDSILVNAVEEMGRIPIRIHTFVVRNIVLPEPITEAIRNKLVAEQNFLRYKFVLLETQEEAKRKGIEAEGIRTYQKTVNENMTDNYLRFEGIKATERLAASPNAKLVVIGGKDGLPLMLNTQDMASSSTPPPISPSVSHDGTQPATQTGSGENTSPAADTAKPLDTLLSTWDWLDRSLLYMGNPPESTESTESSRDKAQP